MHKNTSTMFGLFLLATIVVQSHGDQSDYGVIIDAGSSGTRIRIYAWDEGAWITGEYGVLPEINEVHNLKVKPGISDFADDTAALDEYFDELIAEARNVNPESKQRDTKIFVFATAGMRLLEEDESSAVMDAIDRIMLDGSINPFAYESLNTRILSGEEEGVFAWIAVNYLRGFFNDPEGTQVSGVLELGGLSTQIAFKHDDDILADKFPVTISGHIHPLYVHSYLGFGQTYTLEKVLELAVEREDEVNGERQNPCMIAQDNQTTTINDLEVVTFRGTGIPSKCEEYMEEIVYEADEEYCLPQPCAIGTVYQPTLPEAMPFYALSAYQYTLFELQVPDSEDGSFSAGDLRQAAIDALEMTLEEAEAFFSPRNVGYKSTYTTMGLYLATLLEKAYKFPTDSTQLYALAEINEQPVQWALGALIYEIERNAPPCDVEPNPSAASTFASSVYSSLLIALFCFMTSR